MRRTRARGSLAVNWTKSDDVAVRIVGHEITPISSARRHLEPQRYNQICTTLHGFSFPCVSSKRVQLPWRDSARPSRRPTSFRRNENRTRDEIRQRIIKRSTLKVCCFSFFLHTGMTRKRCTSNANYRFYWSAR